MGRCSLIARIGLWSLVVAMAGCLPATFPAPEPDIDGDGFSVGQGDCNDADPALNPDTQWYIDADGDGAGTDEAPITSCEPIAGRVLEGGDCDDGDDTILPGATEICDGIDQDCDGVADNGADGSAQWYADADKDGYGDDSTVVTSCAPVDGYVEIGGDCNDKAATIHPGADETCDGVDQNCDGTIDNHPTDGTQYYADVDGDTYGSTAVSERSCANPGAGWVTTTGDCADDDALRHPGATETCADPLDMNCDGTTTFADADHDGVAACQDCNDDDDAIGASVTWYVDVDGDGYGDDGLSAHQCAAPSAGYVMVGGDCNDDDATRHPGATESCTDTVDLDCDGKIPGVDLDGDGFPGCQDCDDTHADSHPGGTEVCDGRDNDCDGTIDQSTATDAKNWYVDGDGDGYGATVAGKGCTAPASGEVSKNGDCNDADPAYHPFAPEANCSDINDYNCDGSVGSSDVDGDSVVACLDCDDSNSDIHPGATEVCDPKQADEDCDGTSDDADTSTTGKSSWYVDADGDTYGSGSATRACLRPTDKVLDDTDCNDGDSHVNPGRAEVCDPLNVDENCNGFADDLDLSADIGSVRYVDADSDSYGKSTDPGVKYCDPPSSGVSANHTDCNDANAAINPGATEVCDASHTDENCNGLADDLDSTTSAISKSSWYSDTDTDTYGAGTALAACDQPSGRVARAGDCDDNKASVNPGATELCDASNTDENCNGPADDADATVADAGRSDFWFDGDGDGYGLTSQAVRKCDQPAQYATVNGDCDDASDVINPGAAEICDTSHAVDENCNGTIDDADAALSDGTRTYPDADGDTFGDVNSSGVLTCLAVPPGRVTDNTDCDDAYGPAYPGAPELCDGRYDDCVTKAAWSASDEDGHVTKFPPSGAPIDRTAAWAAGVSGTPVDIDVTGTAGTTISVCDGTYFVRLTAPSALSGVTVSGRNAIGAILDGDGTQSPVDLPMGGTFTLAKMQVTNANVGVQWGGTGTITLDSVDVSGNTSTDVGGGIVATGGTVHLLQSSVTGNVAANDGGGIYLIDASLTVDQSLIDGNTASGNGGGIFLDVSSGTPAIDCTGTAGTGGGGVSGNTALSGGALYVAASTYTVSSTVCDWGTPSVDDNDPDDVADGTGTIGTFADDASFTCPGDGTCN